MICQYCQQDAPVVLKGGHSVCTACGNIRPPTLNEAVNITGEASKVGGWVASGAGWLILAAGLLAATTIGWLVSFVFSTIVALIVFGLIATPTLFVGGGLVLGGRKLKAKGQSKAFETKTKAVVALASNQNGIVRAPEVAQALSISYEEADELLTKIAKRGDVLSLEIDEHGGIYYQLRGAQAFIPRKARVASGSPQSQPNMRVAPSQPEVIEAEFEPVDETHASSHQAHRGH